MTSGLGTHGPLLVLKCICRSVNFTPEICKYMYYKKVVITYRLLSTGARWAKTHFNAALPSNPNLLNSSQIRQLILFQASKWIAQVDWTELQPLKWASWFTAILVKILSLLNLRIFITHCLSQSLCEIPKVVRISRNFFIFSCFLNKFSKSLDSWDSGGKSNPTNSRIFLRFLSTWEYLEIQQSWIPRILMELS